MWTNPSQKSRQGSDPPPHSGNACILGASVPDTPPLQDQESGEDDDPEEFSESSLSVVGIRETRDVCACHKILGIASKDNTC